MDFLLEKFVLNGSTVVRSGDADKIDALLLNELLKVATTDDGWRTLYRQELTGHYWELSYPQGEMQGGGPRQLTRLAPEASETWLAAVGPRP